MMMMRTQHLGQQGDRKKNNLSLLKINHSLSGLVAKKKRRIFLKKIE